jgi:DNA-binding NarL/FixJ family response regulator
LLASSNRSSDRVPKWSLRPIADPLPDPQDLHVTKRISVVLLDDKASTRGGVLTRIRAQRSFHVLGASATLAAALQLVRKTRPDLVFLHLGGTDEDLLLARALHGEAPASRVLIMGLQPHHEDVASLVRAGVSGFIMTNASFDTFLRTLHSVAQGIQVLPLELTHSLFGQLTGHGVPFRPRRTPDVKRLKVAGRVEVAAWSLQPSPFELDQSVLV